MTARDDVARMALRTARPVHLQDRYANPRALLRHHAANGDLIRVAPGYYIAPPDDRPRGWLPAIETIAAGVAAAAYPDDDIVLMGVTAARIHGAIPRAIGTAVVAAPKQHAPITLDRGGRIVFVARDTRQIDAVRMPTETGRVLVTGIEQTMLDLAKRPDLGGYEDEALHALTNLAPRVDATVLKRLAVEQRIPRGALTRIEDAT